MKPYLKQESNIQSLDTNIDLLTTKSIVIFQVILSNLIHIFCDVIIDSNEYNVFVMISEIESRQIIVGLSRSIHIPQVPVEPEKSSHF